MLLLVEHWYNMSLELRVKEKLPRYPEEMFFASQGIPVKTIEFLPHHASPGLITYQRFSFTRWIE